MKQFRLILMRHAKSDWDTDAPTDHARPLNNRGRREAPRVARRLVEIQWEPELILSSDSQRTRETCGLVNEELDSSPELIFLDSLYHGGPREITTAILEADHSCNPIMVVGHNPGWEEAVRWWTHEPVRMTTANAALLQIKATDWPSAINSNDQWGLVEILRPKEIDDK